MARRILPLFFLIFLVGCSTISKKQLLVLEDELNVAVNSFPTENIIPAADKILEYVPNHPDANYQKGDALMMLGKYIEAIVWFDKAIKYHHLAKGSNDFILMDSLYYKAMSLEMIGRLEEALESYDLAIMHGYYDPVIYDFRNQVLTELGRRPE
jgi:superkiller protein 3